MGHAIAPTWPEAHDDQPCPSVHLMFDGDMIRIWAGMIMELDTRTIVPADAASNFRFWEAFFAAPPRATEFKHGGWDGVGDWNGCGSAVYLDLERSLLECLQEIVFKRAGSGKLSKPFAEVEAMTRTVLQSRMRKVLFDVFREGLQARVKATNESAGIVATATPDATLNGHRKGALAAT